MKPAHDDILTSPLLVSVADSPAGMLLDVTRHLCEGAGKRPIDGVYILLEAAAILMAQCGENNSVPRDQVETDWATITSKVLELVLDDADREGSTLQ